MKKQFLFLLALAAVTVVSAQHGAKLSPFTRQYLKAAETANARPDLVLKKTDDQVYAGAIVKVSDPAKAAYGITALGGFIGTKAGNIWTVKMPKEQIARFTGLNGLSYVQLDEPVKPDLVVVRSVTRTDSVHRGIALPAAYNGKGVVMGVIDFGFDYTHPAFYDTLGARYRIKRIWELNGTGTPPAGYSYGNEITDTNAMKTKGTDNAAQAHGACVAGVAAGSGYGSFGNSRSRGIAYDADLVFVGVRRDSIEKQWMQGGFSDFLDGINYIFQYASSVGKPAVVNISWGSQSGPHDGTTLFNEACDNLANMGHIIVMSAGNEGQEKIHLSKTFTPQDTTLRTFLDFTPATYKRTWIDIWGDSNKTFCVNVSLFANGIETKSTGFVCVDGQIHDTVLLNDLSQDSCTVQFITSLAEYNGKPRLTINLFNKTLDSVLVTVKANDGKLHLWNEYYYYGYTNRYLCDFASYGYPWAQDGNTETTISDMGSSRSVILVGAYVSKVGWRDVNGETWSYGGESIGKIATFSSRGPLTNGTVKPDITAPGLTMATSTNSFNPQYTPTGASSSMIVAAYTEPVTNKKYYYSEFTGTSASAPVTSGVVALMLQANPTMSPSQVKNILQQTAFRDAHTGTLPPQGDNTWGPGKINAYAAVKMATQQTGLYSFAGVKLDCALFPNPNNGRFTLDYSTARKEALTVEIYDLKGTLISTANWMVENGNNSKDLDLTSYEKGLYLIKVSSGEGTVVMRSLVQ